MKKSILLQFCILLTLIISVLTLKSCKKDLNEFNQATNDLQLISADANSTAEQFMKEVVDQVGRINYINVSKGLPRFQELYGNLMLSNISISKNELNQIERIKLPISNNQEKIFYYIKAVKENSKFNYYLVNTSYDIKEEIMEEQGGSNIYAIEIEEDDNWNGSGGSTYCECEPGRFYGLLCRSLPCPQGCSYS